MLYYWARQYVKNIKKSEKYSELKRTIGVLIANFELEELKEKGFHSKWKVKDDDDGGRKNSIDRPFRVSYNRVTKVASNDDKTKRQEFREMDALFGKSREQRGAKVYGRK